MDRCPYKTPGAVGRSTPPPSLPVSFPYQPALPPPSRPAAGPLPSPLPSRRRPDLPPPHLGADGAPAAAAIPARGAGPARRLRRLQGPQGTPLPPPRPGAQPGRASFKGSMPPLECTPQPFFCVRSGPGKNLKMFQKNFFKDPDFGTPDFGWVGGSRPDSPSPSRGLKRRWLGGLHYLWSRGEGIQCIRTTRRAPDRGWEGRR